VTAAEAAAQEEVELAVVKIADRRPPSTVLSRTGRGVVCRDRIHGEKGEVLCIIEAMKLMNEIDSEYDARSSNIYVENGQPVQYGERLFAIRTK